MTVFVLRDEQTLVPLEPAEFATEDDFQLLLAKFPSLLSWEQNDAGMPRRWLLLKREKAIPAEDGGGGRWSVDHLFVDQDGVPTLVEVKRQSDTRLRREVVGQMLDYAANAVVYWPIDQLRRNSRQLRAEEARSSRGNNRGILAPTGSGNVMATNQDQPSSWAYPHAVRGGSDPGWSCDGSSSS